MPDIENRRLSHSGGKCRYQRLRFFFIPAGDNDRDAFFYQRPGDAFAEINYSRQSREVDWEPLKAV